MTPDVLRVLNRGTHDNLKKLIAHCSSLTDDELNRQLEGFGYPTVRLQLHHLLGAAKYWIGVIEGTIDAEDDSHLYPTTVELEQYRQRVFELTDQFLKEATSDELDTPRIMETWGGRKRQLSPCKIVLRIQTHSYHHQGQILAMCRLMGKPGGGVDFPIE